MLIKVVLQPPVTIASRVMNPNACLRIFSALLSFFLVALATGCRGTTYAVKVDASAKSAASRPSTDGQSYKIRSKNPVLGEENLRYKEAAEYVKTALSGKGLFEAPNTEAADLIVELDYGVDAPRTKIETRPPPAISLPTTLTLAALTIASAASIAPSRRPWRAVATTTLGA